MIVKMLFSREIGQRFSQAKLTKYAESVYFEKKNKLKEYLVVPNTKCTFNFCISFDGKYLASMHGDHNIIISEVQLRNQVTVLKGHTRSPWCAVFHPKANDVLVSGCLAGNVIIWKINYERPEMSYVLARYDAINLPITAIMFHSSENYFLFSSESFLYYWHLSDQQPSKFISFDSKIKYLKLVNNDSVILIGFEVNQKIYVSKGYSAMKIEMNDLNQDYYATLNDLKIEPLSKGSFNVDKTFSVLSLIIETSVTLSQELLLTNKSLSNMIASAHEFLIVKYREMDITITEFKEKLLNANQRSYESDDIGGLRCMHVFIFEYIQTMTANSKPNLFLKYIHAALNNLAQNVPSNITQTTETLERCYYFASVFHKNISVNFFKLLTYIERREILVITAKKPLSPNEQRQANLEFLLLMMLIQGIILTMRHYIEIHLLPNVNGYLSSEECNVQILQPDPRNDDCSLRFNCILALDYDDSQFFSEMEPIVIKNYSNEAVIPSCTITNNTSVAVTDKHKHLIAVILYTMTVGVYSYGRENFGQLLYMLPSEDLSFPISLAISPYENYLVVANRQMNETYSNVFMVHKWNDSECKVIVTQPSSAKVNVIQFLNNLYEGFVIGVSNDGILQCYSSP